jgi:type II secretory pathway component PulK
MDLLKVKPAKSGQGSDDGKLTEITVKWLAEHMDALTLSDEKRLAARVNVNTAPREVLMTLPQVKAATAERIVARRLSGDGPFEHLAQLLEDNLMTEEQFKACGEKLTLRSQVFEIRSSAVTRQGVRHDIVAVVDRGGENLRILYWWQSQ